MHGPFADVLGLDTAIEYAASGSSTVRGVTGHLRRASLAGLTMHAATQTIKQHRTLYQGPPDPLHEETATLLTAAPSVVMREVDSLVERVERTLWTELQSPSACTSRLLMLDRLCVVLAAFREAQAARMRLDCTNPPRTRIRYAYHHDAVLAVQHGLRAFCAMVAVSTFWIVSAWPSGAGCVATVGVVYALFSTRPNSMAGALGFLKGATFAALVGVLCHFALFLAILGDFVMLAAVVSVFMLLAGIAMRSPRTAAPGSAFALFFWRFASLNNTSWINEDPFLNSMIATLLAIALGTLAFAVMFPANHRARQRRLYRSARRDLIDIADRPQRWTASEWLSRMADRMSRTIAISDAKSQVDLEHKLGDLLATWTIGDCLLRLAALSQQDFYARRAVDLVRRRLAQGQVARLSGSCDSAARQLRRRATAGSHTDRRLLRAVALFGTISETISSHNAFFRDPT